MKVTGYHINRGLKHFAVKSLIAFILLLSVSVANGQQALSVIANKKGTTPAISNNELRSVRKATLKQWSQDCDCIDKNK